MTFPRARTYRAWVQFQRQGVLITVRFDVPVKQLEEEPPQAPAKK